MDFDHQRRPCGLDCLSDGRTEQCQCLVEGKLANVEQYACSFVVPDGVVSWISTRGGGDAPLLDVFFPIIFFLSITYAHATVHGMPVGVSGIVGFSKMAVDGARLLAYFGDFSCIVFAVLHFYSFGCDVAILVVRRCRLFD